MTPKAQQQPLLSSPPPPPPPLITSFPPFFQLTTYFINYNGQVARRGSQLLLPRKWTTSDRKFLQIISSKPKTGRRGSGRRAAGTARAQVLGKPVATPVQRARAAVAPVEAPKAVAQGSEKIVVSNLPGDVNEAQIKVRLIRAFGTCTFLISSGYL